MKVVTAVMLLMLPFAVQCSELPARIEVFINGSTKVLGIDKVRARGVAVEVFDIAPAVNLEKALSRSLSTSERAAARQVKKRMDRLSEKDKAAALQGVIARHLAEGYGITRFPALVFDASVIIYGTRRLQTAIAKWRQIK